MSPENSYMQTQTAPINPDIFFQEAVPLAFEASKLARRKANIAGICEIALYGEGCATWTLDLGEGTVTRSRAESPDVYLEMKREDFQSMLAEELDVASAIEEGRIRLQGEVQLIETLSMLLRPRTLPY